MYNLPNRSVLTLYIMKLQVVFAEQSVMRQASMKACMDSLTSC